MEGEEVRKEFTEKLLDPSGAEEWMTPKDLYEAPDNRADPGAIKSDPKQIMIETGYAGDADPLFRRALGRLTQAWESASDARDQQTARKAEAPGDQARPLDDGEMELLKTQWGKLYCTTCA